MSSSIQSRTNTVLKFTVLLTSILYYTLQKKKKKIRNILHTSSKVWQDKEINFKFWFISFIKKPVTENDTGSLVFNSSKKYGLRRKNAVNSHHAFTFGKCNGTEYV